MQPSASLSGVRLLHLAAADSMLNPNLREQLIFLRDEGCEVHTASIDGPLARRLRDEDGFAWTALPLSRELAPLSDLRAVRCIENLCRGKKFDLVHTHTPKGNFAGLWGARLACVPVVLQTLHGFYFHERMNAVARRAWIGIEKFNASHADFTLCQNPEDVATALEEGIIPADRLALLGNGIDVQRFTPPDDAARIKAREKFGLPLGARVVGMVGRFVREKGFPEFLQAAMTLEKDYPDVYFLAVGHRLSSERSGEEFDFDAGSSASNNARPRRLTVLTDRDDMPEIYASMDIHVLPSHREGFPRSMLEAAASGLPQVATHIRGCRQVVIEGQNGFLVQPLDVAALCAGLRRLLDDAPLRARMGRAARALALEKFDRQNVFNRLRSCYQRLLF